jgi:hypothetical protein
MSSELNASHHSRAAGLCERLASDPDAGAATRERFRAYAAQERRLALRARANGQLFPVPEPAVRRSSSAREPRRRTGARRTTRTVGARGSPDSEPSGSRRRLRVIPPERFRRDVDAWLETVAR